MRVEEDSMKMMCWSQNHVKMKEMEFVKHMYTLERGGLNRI